MNNLYTNPPKGSDQFRSLLLQNEAEKLYQPPADENHFYVQKGVIPLTPTEVKISTISGNEIVRNFEKRRKAYLFGEKTSLLAVDLVIGAMKGALMLAGPEGKIASFVVGAAGDALKKVMQTNRFKNVEKKLAMDLARYRAQHGDFAALKFPDDGNIGRKRFDLLYNNEHPVLDPAFDNVSEEGRALVQGTLIKMLADGQVDLINNDRILFNSLADMGVKLEQQGIKVANLEKHVVEIDRAFLDFRDTTKKRLDNIEGNINTIQTTLENVNTRLDNHEKQIAENTSNIEVNRVLIHKNRQDIDYLQQSLFGKMDPTEQLEALRHGFFEGMADEERKQLTDKIEGAQARKELFDNISGFMNGAKDLLTIADNLHIDVPQEARQVVQYGTAALNVGLSIASGNYIGAVASLTGMLGGRGGGVT